MRVLISKISQRWIVVAHDLFMVPVAWLGAYWLRFNLEAFPAHMFIQALTDLPFVLVIQAGTLWFFGVYRGIWRFASVPDLIRIIKAVVAGVVVIAIAVFLVSRLEGVPRSVFPLYGLLLLILLSGPRMAYRWLKDHALPMTTGQPTLIVGAGHGAEMLVRDLLRAKDTGYQPVGFVDDDPRNRGKEIHGLRVIGATTDIPRLVTAYGVQLIVIAVPSANAREMRRIVEQCELGGVPFRTLPGVADIVAGRAVLQTLREVSIDDLLGREQVSLDWQAISSGLGAKTVLVSGGGGSIGSELCRQVARLQPAGLVILENSEFNLYQIEMELRQAYPELTLHVHLCDVTDSVAVTHWMQHYRPSVVFHAAAYKHVPLLEHQVREALHNNVLGTRTLALAADRCGCNTFVLISTDKAVNPTNVMGASKRVAEIFCQSLDRHSTTHFITVRFGNVLGSAGSVVPLFRQQIARGGPVTVTHPEVTRFFMTIPEASQLIMQAAVMGKGGEIYVLDMGEPVKIVYLAEQMIRLAGKVPGEDVEIVYSGLRPGEKMYEELFHEKESLMGTAHEKILLARHRETDWGELQGLMDRLDAQVNGYDEQSLADLLQALVPEFKPDDVVADTNVVPLNSHTRSLK